MAPRAAEKRLAQLRSAVEGLAAEDAGELIAEARREARGRARELLADVMVEAMLERAQAQLRAKPQPRAVPARETKAPFAARTEGPGRTEAIGRTEPPGRRAPDRAAEPKDEITGVFGLYIYCVVPAGIELPNDSAGIEATQPLTMIEHENVAAVVSKVSLDEFEEQRLRAHLADMEWVERTARAHELALEMIGKTAPLIPMRMCSVYRDEHGVREMLEREATALEGGLAHLEGKAEWGVKIFAGEPDPDGEPRPDAGEQFDSTGTDYMRQRQAARDARHEASEQLTNAAATVHERLSEHVVDALSTPLQRPELTGHEGEMLHNGVYLVQDQAIEDFLGLVHALQDDYRELELELTGPWPAYNFVPGTIGATW